MNKKYLYGIIVLTVCCMLTGCHMSHEWQEATCTTPRTCSTGGETEGEALGHTWVDATCSAPKTCSVCGETEGDTLEHTWVDATCSAPKTCSVCGETEGNALEHTLTEANYQQAATCEVCGETVGEPLQAYFEKYGLVCNTELDTTYSLIVPCANNNEYTTEGKFTFSDHEVFESDEAHEALEDYEWRAVTMTIIFDDENASKYGFEGFFTSLFDYYDETFNNSEEDDTFNYNGVDYPECQSDFEVLQVGWNDDHTHTEQVRLYYHIPKGYDGAVLTLLPNSKKADYDNYVPVHNLVDDDTIFFRFK